MRRVGAEYANLRFFKRDLKILLEDSSPVAGFVSTNFSRAAAASS